MRERGWEWTLQPFFRSPQSDITLFETWTNRFVLKFTSNAYKWHRNSHYIFACFIIFLKLYSLHIYSCSTSPEQGFTATDMAYSQPSWWNCSKISRQLTNIRFHLKRKRGSPKAFFPMFTVPMRNQSHLTPLNSWQLTWNLLEVMHRSTFYFKV